MRNKWILTSVIFACSAASSYAGPSNLVSVNGGVATPGVFDLTDLQALPQSTQTDSFTAGGSPFTDTFTGPTLWNVLNAAGGIKTRPGVKNDVLQTYVIATGTDGYKAINSSGEIAPNFGHKADLAAISDTGGTLPGSAGVARTTAPGDVAGGRYVSNVESLTVGHGPLVAGAGGGATTSFNVLGLVNTPTTFGLSALEALTPHTETVTYNAGGHPVTDTYTGALLWDVLAQSTIRTDPGIKNDILRKGVVATGSDGYSVDFAAGELSPKFGNEPILVAYSDTLGQLGTGGADGFARLVVPGDIVGGRYVSNLYSLTVFDAVTGAVPEPSTWALMLAGMAGLGWISRYRSRTAIRQQQANG